MFKATGVARHGQISHTPSRDRGPAVAAAAPGAGAVRLHRADAPMVATEKFRTVFGFDSTAHTFLVVARLYCSLYSPLTHTHLAPHRSSRHSVGQRELSWWQTHGIGNLVANSVTRSRSARTSAEPSISLTKSASLGPDSVCN